MIALLIYAKKWKSIIITLGDYLRLRPSTISLVSQPLHKEEGSSVPPLLELLNPGEHEYANFVAAARQQDASMNHNHAHVVHAAHVAMVSVTTKCKQA